LWETLPFLFEENFTSLAKEQLDVATGLKKTKFPSWPGSCCSNSTTQLWLDVIILPNFGGR